MADLTAAEALRDLLDVLETEVAVLNLDLVELERAVAEHPAKGPKGAVVLEFKRRDA